MGLKSIGWMSVKWIYLAQDMEEVWVVIDTMTNFRVVQNARHLLTR
jgi:hypothetical protein